jgi:hypothetical protein
VGFEDRRVDDRRRCCDGLRSAATETSYLVSKDAEYRTPVVLMPGWQFVRLVFGHGQGYRATEGRESKSCVHGPLPPRSRNDSRDSQSHNIVTCPFHVFDPRRNEAGLGKIPGNRLTPIISLRIRIIKGRRRVGWGDGTRPFNAGRMLLSSPLVNGNERASHQAQLALNPDIAH